MNDGMLRDAIDAAFKAGKAILQIYDGDFEVEKKADDSPLTIADKQSHEIIKDLLTHWDIPFLSEEGKEISFQERKEWKTYWLVDPLDGTKEFIKRNGEFTVNIALMADKTPDMGVIYVPVKDELYFAQKDIGTFKVAGFEPIYQKIVNQSAEPTEDLVPQLLSIAARLPVEGREKSAFTIIGSRSHASEALQEYVEKLRTEHGEMEFISAGSSLKFCLVAEGQADQYPRLGPTMEWDTAAGQVIAECAGAKVVEHESGLPLQYNKESLLNPWFIVDRNE